MKANLFLIILSAAAFAHETAQADPLDALRDNSGAVVAFTIVFFIIASVFYLMFPIKKRYRTAALAVFGMLGLVFVSLTLLSLSAPDVVPAQFHIHADFKVFLNGVPFNFSQEKYMSSNASKLSDYVHLHDMDGDVIHVHARGISLGDFFGTINMSLNSTCFVTDGGASYCDEGNKTLRMFVRHDGGQWAEESGPGAYVMQDLDQMLVTYGDEDAAGIAAQEAAVTDKACIQSEKCPERGSPTDSSCAGDFCSA
jgi:hypothetical protein